MNVLQGSYIAVEALFVPPHFCLSTYDIRAIDLCEVWGLSRSNFDKALDEMGSKFVNAMSFVRSKVSYSREGKWLLAKKPLDLLHSEGCSTKLVVELSIALKAFGTSSLIEDAVARREVGRFRSLYLEPI
jgi:CRP-like cAMP-binding protein